MHNLCVPDRKLLGLSLPCVAVDLEAGYAVVPDPGGTAQLLLVPTRRIVGIEDLNLLKPDAPDYWQDAWQVRRLLAQRLRKQLPRQAVAMAVNSIAGRSQDQLHIHVSCVRSDIADMLRAAAPKLGERWSSVMLEGQAWQARTVAGEDLGANDPFKLAAAAAPDAPNQMGLTTLVVVGAQLSDGAPGFYLLTRLSDPSQGDSGHGEFLLDETCRSASATPSGVR